MAPRSSTHLPLEGQAEGVWSEGGRKSDFSSESPKREDIGTMSSYHLQGENEYTRQFYNARWLVWKTLPRFMWVVEEKFLVFLSYSFEWGEKNVPLTNWLYDCSAGLERVGSGRILCCLKRSEIGELYKYRMSFILDPEIPKRANKIHLKASLSR